MYVYMKSSFSKHHLHNWHCYCKLLFLEWRLSRFGKDLCICMSMYKSDDGMVVKCYLAQWTTVPLYIQHTAIKNTKYWYNIRKDVLFCVLFCWFHVGVKKKIFGSLTHSNILSHTLTLSRHKNIYLMWYAGLHSGLGKQSSNILLATC